VLGHLFGPTERRAALAAKGAAAPAAPLSRLRTAPKRPLACALVKHVRDGIGGKGAARDDVGESDIELGGAVMIEPAAGGGRWSQAPTQLDRDLLTRYASTAGTLGRRQLELLTETIAKMPAGSIVVAAFDADAIAGSTAVERHVPPVPRTGTTSSSSRSRT
jgi:hypothetical protein